MPLSIDLRKRVMTAVDHGMRITNIAKSFQISRKTIYHWLNLRKTNGNVEPKSGYQKGHSHKILDWEKFREFARVNGHLTSSKMAIEWEKITSIRVSESVIQRALKKIGYTSKKNFWVHRSQRR